MWEYLLVKDAFSNFPYKSNAIKISDSTFYQNWVCTKKFSYWFLNLYYFYLGFAFGGRKLEGATAYLARTL